MEFWRILFVIDRATLRIERLRLYSDGFDIYERSLSQFSTALRAFFKRDFEFFLKVLQTLDEVWAMYYRFNSR